MDLPPNGCVNHLPVSAAASALGCKLAMNAGFFSFPPTAACERNLIVNASVVQWKSDDAVVMGLTADAAVIGFLNATSYERYQFRGLVSGMGWLVRDGVNYVNSSRDISPNETFVVEKAPRTGFGVRADGTLLALVVDGVESTRAGPDLYEFGDVFISLGAVQAMNLDGGGEKPKTTY